MSIIIRLQNLSWSANSVDIRQFFHGLVIPEGGVHIVGGPKGDAFIAFATDEDARQAMERSGGNIKDMKIKLMLSSRTEMQRVIEQARNPNPMSLAPIVPPVAPPAPAMPSFPLAEKSMSKERESKDSKETDRHRHRSRSSERHRERDRSSDRDRSRRSSRRGRSPPKRSRERERSRDKERDRPRRDDRRRHDDKRDEHHKRDATRDRESSRHKSNEPSSIDHKVPIATIHPESQPDQQDAPWKSSFHSVEKSQPAPVWDSIKKTFENPVPKDPMPPFHNKSSLKGFSDAPDMPPQDRRPSYPEEPGPLPNFDPHSNERMHPGPHFGNAPFQGGPGENMRMGPQRPPYGNMGGDPMGGPRPDMPPYGAGRGPRFPFPNEASPEKMPCPPDNFGPPPNRFPPEPPFSGQNSGPPFPDHRPFGEDKPPFEPRFPDDFPQRPRHSGPNFYGGPPNFKRNFNDFPNRMPHHQMRGFNNFENGPPYNKPPLNKNAQFGSPPGFFVEVIANNKFTYKEIREFFRPSRVPSDGLKLTKGGSNVGHAYVRLTSEKDMSDALNKNGINGFEVIPSSQEAFDNAIDPGYVAKVPPRLQPESRPPPFRGEKFEVFLKGLPYQCKEADIADFFRGLNIKNIYIEYDNFGKAVGSGFVSFFSQEDVQNALKLNNEKIRHRFIEIMPCGEQEPFNPPGYDRHPPGPKPPMPSASNDPPFCVALNGLPPYVTKRDIAEFFGSVGVVPTNIHLAVGFDGQAYGNAFAEIVMLQDFEKALSKNGQPMHDKNISVTAIQFQEMVEIMKRPPPKPDLPPIEERNYGCPPSMEFEKPDVRPSQGPPSFGEPNDFGPRFIPPGPPMPSYPPRPNMRMPAGGGPMSGPPITRPPGILHNPQQFGKPGCVIGISGIPPTAGVTEILDFIKDFNMSKENVIRKFDDQGNPTGDARVALNTPQDAQRAVQDLHNKILSGKPVSVFIV